ncbi:MAG: hypothetical protein J6U04_08930 [Salinivirgaceae bacterium]|nr:hypothetical protein [Salinivirgaceae bacterium]
MSNPIYIACDNEDEKLGHFFQSCHDKIREVAVANGFDYMSLMSQHLTKDNVNKHTSKADEYIFSAFSHGTDDTLVCGTDAYVKTNENVKNFYSSVFYTFSCDTANGIGQEFKDAYVLGYFGYNSAVWVISSPAFENMFVECATKGLVSYIEGKTLKEAVADLVAEYDKNIKNAKINPIYSCLLKNKQALVTIINNSDKTIKE